VTDYAEWGVPHEDSESFPPTPFCALEIYHVIGNTQRFCSRDRECFVGNLVLHFTEETSAKYMNFVCCRHSYNGYDLRHGRRSRANTC